MSMPTRERLDSCAAVSQALQEPVAGTAPVAQAWVAVEMPGTWPAKVLADQAHPWLGALEARAKVFGVSVIAVRKPGRVGRTGPAGVRALVACTLPGRTVAGELTLADPEELAELDLGQLAGGVLAPRARPLASNVLLVCTNAKRDACCAVAGRALVDELDRARPGQIWECSHLGGHRFAPTALVLPSGYAYARLTAQTALRLLDAAPTAAPELTDCRGRSCWDRKGQVAELEARLLLGAGSGPVADADALTVDVTGPDLRTVRGVDGVSVPVVVGEALAAPARAISCGAGPVTPPVLTALVVGPAEAGQPAA